MKNYLVYNPLANNNNGEKIAKEAVLFLKERFPNLEELSIIGLNTKDFVSELKKDDNVVLVGGDGTLNHAVNELYNYDFPCDLYLYKAGTGNDFLKDVLGEESNERIIKINEYIKPLPRVIVNGKERRFINGIGYGIDGTACEVADKQRAKGKKKINYTSISIKLCLFGYKRPNAKVTVDGVTKEYKYVWLASAMNGKYYGGGMKVAPNQDRKSNLLTSVIFHGRSRIKTLMAFPKIFTGEHVKKTKLVDVQTGKHIKVEFTKPTALQIDGETILGVTSYEAIID